MSETCSKTKCAREEEEKRERGRTFPFLFLFLLSNRPLQFKSTFCQSATSMQEQGQGQGQGQPNSSGLQQGIRPPRDQHGASRFSDEPMNEDFDMEQEHTVANHSQAHGDMHYHGGYTHRHDHVHGNGHSHSHDHNHDHNHSHSHEHSHNGMGRGIELDKDDDVHEEVLHFHKIVKAFSQYKASALYANHRRRTDFYSLPERQQM